MSITIEKGIPLPTTGVGRQRGEVSTAILLMDVGDSAVIRTDHPKRMSVSISYCGKRYGLKFTTRKLEEGKFRVWRLA